MPKSLVRLMRSAQDIPKTRRKQNGDVHPFSGDRILRLDSLGIRLPTQSGGGVLYSCIQKDIMGHGLHEDS